jgi:hypothetical protein
MLADPRRPVTFGQHRKSPERQVDALHLLRDFGLTQVARPEPAVVAKPLGEFLLSLLGRNGKTNHKLGTLTACLIPGRTRPHTPSRRKDIRSSVAPGPLPLQHRSPRNENATAPVQRVHRPDSSAVATSSRGVPQAGQKRSPGSTGQPHAGQGSPCGAECWGSTTEVSVSEDRSSPGRSTWFCMVVFSPHKKGCIEVSTGPNDLSTSPNADSSRAFARYYTPIKTRLKLYHKVCF